MLNLVDIKLPLLRQNIVSISCFFLRQSMQVCFVVNGETQWINARQFTDDEVLKWLNLLKSQSSNRTGIRLRKLIHTDNPSIQGPWTPYMFR